MKKFINGSVPVKVAARVYGKNNDWIREGLISGWLQIGFATRNGKRVTSTAEVSLDKGRINFYISPKRLYEETGYVWEGERK